MRGRWWIVFPLFLIAVGCGGGRVEGPQPADSPVRIVVTNRYSLAMEVYIVGAGTRHRLGTVDPGLVGRFSVPSSMIGGGPLELFARPTPRAAQREQAESGPLLLAPGVVVDFVISPQLFNSTATLRP